ncbi:hypothetical protein PPERSA_05708 [Pseudocohnilembus persalinus]|uniref:H/ACA ribonucleoprotein complex subunit 2 n=1 Tax=Pseudocohnilembus persalinus TaxID=266149 RepID=A0A0V0QM95_PSEPJ|nr:hypothetical protein PPERSA_05708 [Pseudocohnilembus persalinus]|eukprot:KRX03350.1 hypothetical protein PPERSA_05708 [Pseudocohnilembus persalinus]
MSDIEEQELQFYQSPIANPLASEKLQIKLLKLTKKFVKSKQIKRGVKEVVKGIRKGFTGIVILSGDVSPVDVISHIPLLCENKDIPYVYVRSRMELGVAAQTKKPTSVVLLTPGKDCDEGLQAKFEAVQQKIRKINPYL